MIIQFSKYQGTGNDFIMINGFNFSPKNIQDIEEIIPQLCDRRFGIGADGLIILISHSSTDFEVLYFNADGTQSFCGNGARCAVHFANSLEIIKSNCVFMAIDGIHSATINEQGIVSLKMQDVREINNNGDHYVIDTGSPHYISFVKNLEEMKIVDFGKKIRYSATYKEEGINVNAVEILSKDFLKMLTYERGVEDETYSCGTGATAVALAYADKNKETIINVKIQVKGGELSVKAIREGEQFHSIFLIGPAKRTFEGTFTIQ